MGEVWDFSLGSIYQFCCYIMQLQLQPHKPVFVELPITKIEKDSDQPRRNLGEKYDEHRLKTSIKDYGIEEPLKVSEKEPGRFIIMDGHRRFTCAQNLGLKTIPCRVYPRMQIGEFEARRFQMQNNRKPWKPLERAQSINRIKMGLGFKTLKELAQFLYMSESTVGYSLALRDVRVDYTDLMEKHQLNQSYRNEFLKLKDKLRKIRTFEVDQIVEIVFEKVKQGTIKNAKEFRVLKRIFLRATANSAELYQFLKNPDMTIKELDQRTVHSGSSILIEQLIQKIAEKRKDGISFSTQEKNFLKQLQILITKVI